MVMLRMGARISSPSREVADWEVWAQFTIAGLFDLWRSL